MESISFSVIICTFQRPELLRSCLESLHSCTPPSVYWEIIVIDNNSGDSTVKVIKDFKAALPNLSFSIIFERNLSVARNKGCDLAVGDYLVYLDDDAKVPREYLVNVEACLTKNQPDLMGGPVYPYYTTAKPSWFRDSYETKKFAAISEFSTKARVTGANFTIRKSTLKEVGMFDPLRGMQGKSYVIGDERKVLDTYRHITPPNLQRVYYSVECFVYHHVDPRKLRFHYFLYRAFVSAQTNAMIRASLGKENPSSADALKGLIWLPWELARDICAEYRRFRPKRDFPLHFQSAAAKVGTFSKVIQMNLSTKSGFLNKLIERKLGKSVTGATIDSLANFLDDTVNLRSLALAVGKQKEHESFDIALKLAGKVPVSVLQAFELISASFPTELEEQHRILKFLTRPGIFDMLKEITGEKENREAFFRLLDRIAQEPGEFFALNDMLEEIVAEKENREAFSRLLDRIAQEPGEFFALYGGFAPREESLDAQASFKQTVQAALDRMVHEYGSGVRLDEMHLVPMHIGTSAALMVDLRENHEFWSLATDVVESEQGILYYDRLYNLYQTLREVISRFEGVGIVALEAGVYRGKTSEFLCKILAQSSSGSRYFAVDTFEGHSEKDLPSGEEGAHRPGKFADTSEEMVIKMLSPYSFAKVLRGRVQDRAPEINEPIFHFVHLDMDIYEPTLWGMEFFSKRMPKGGVIVVDDYRKKKCPGIETSVEKFCAENPGVFFRFDTQTAQCLLVRQ